MNYFNNNDIKPKYFISRMALIRVLLILSAILIINLEKLSAEGISRIDLAEHWAPVIYQKVDDGPINPHGLNGRSDFITNFDFDVPPPAENKAIAGAFAIQSSIEITLNS